MTEISEARAPAAVNPQPAHAALALDHLIVLARTLDEGTEYVADALAVDPVDGAAHRAMGTHDRLVGMWGGMFIRIVAPDPDAAAPAHARWFGFDSPAVQWRLAAGPFLAHWAARLARPRRLPLWQSQYPQRLAPVAALAAGPWTWRAGIPEDGSFPQWRGSGEGILPTLVQYDTPAHPGAALAPADLRLTRLCGLHPRSDILAPQLAWLGASGLIDLQRSAREPALAAHFETPFGPRVLK